jgi:prophage antirepressor-like protein
LIGILFSESGNYEIIFRSKKDKKIIFRELISF